MCVDAFFFIRYPHRSIGIFYGFSLGSRADQLIGTVVFVARGLAVDGLFENIARGIVGVVLQHFAGGVEDLPQLPEPVVAVVLAAAVDLAPGDLAGGGVEVAQPGQRRGAAHGLFGQPAGGGVAEIERDAVDGLAAQLIAVVVGVGGLGGAGADPGQAAEGVVGALLAELETAVDGLAQRALTPGIVGVAGGDAGLDLFAQTAEVVVAEGGLAPVAGDPFCEGRLYNILMLNERTILIVLSLCHAYGFICHNGCTWNNSSRCFKHIISRIGFQRFEQNML